MLYFLITFLAVIWLGLTECRQAKDWLLFARGDPTICLLVGGNTYHFNGTLVKFTSLHAPEHLFIVFIVQLSTLCMIGWTLMIMT